MTFYKKYRPTKHLIKKILAYLNLKTVGATKTAKYLLHKHNSSQFQISKISSVIA